MSTTEELEMKKMNGESMNIVNENIEKLKEIFPEIFSEGKLVVEKLEEELGEFIDKNDERYDFTWNETKCQEDRPDTKHMNTSSSP